MKFIVDAQLPASLAHWLRLQGHEADHVGDVGLLDADDGEIRRHTLAANAILVTKYRDFVLPPGTGIEPATVVWVRTGNLPNKTLLQRFAAVWPSVEAHLDLGVRIVEIR